MVFSVLFLRILSECFTGVISFDEFVLDIFPLLFSLDADLRRSSEFVLN